MKRKLGGAIVKRCIVTAMTVMLVSNSGLTVRAEESVQVQEQQDVQEQVEVQAQQQDNAAGEDNQNTGDEAGEDNQNTDNEAGADSQNADNAAQDEDLQQVASEVEETVEEAASQAEEAAQEASEIAEDTEQKLEAIESEVEENREALEEAASEIQSGADETEQEVKDSLVTVTDPDGEEQYEVIVGEKTEEDGSITTVTMKDYVDTQTQIAENAKAELEKALDENSDDEKIAEYAEAVKEAAKDVYNAAYLAEKAFSNAEAKLKDEIKRYNACAKAYGYELISYNGEILEYTQEEQEQFNAEAGLTQETEEIRQELAEIVETDLEEQKEKIEQAQQTVEEAKDTYESAQKAADDMQQSVQEAQKAVQNAGADEAANTADSNAQNQDTQTKIEEAEKNIEQAQQKYDTAKNELDDVIMSVKNTVPNLSSLRMELTRKIAAMNSARQDLYKVRDEKKAAASYVAWADELVKASQSKVVTGVYGQLVGTKNENAEFSYSNDKQFDKGDADVVTRDQINFAPISETTDIVVPYDIFKAYVKELYDYRTKDGKLVLYGEADKRIGLGISSTDNGTMNKIYWKYDTKTKKIIPETMFVLRSDEDQLPDWMTQEGSVYFVGYTFKHENDGYHIDGHLCKASTPDAPDTPDTPSEGGSSDTSTQNDDTTDSDTVVIPDVVTPLSDGITVIPDEDVPLASSFEPDIVVLDDEQVPLSDTVPKTGDAPRTEYPFLLAGVSAMLAAVVSKAKKKKQ